MLLSRFRFCSAVVLFLLSVICNFFLYLLCFAFFVYIFFVSSCAKSVKLN